MKKSVYLLMTFAAVFFTSCEPMEDIHEEVNAAIDAEPNIGIVELSLVEDDYTGDVEDGGLGLDDAYFTSLDAANAAIPGFLDARYPVLGKGSIASVNVEIAEPLSSDPVEYEVTAEDYSAQGLKYGNFDRDSHIQTFLNTKYSDAEEGTLVELTYKWYQSGETTTRTNTFVLTEGVWNQVLVLERDQYKEMGEAYPNFDNRAEAIQKVKVFLNENMPYAAVGSNLAVLFKVHIGGGNTESYVKTFTFDGTSWSGSFNSVLQFGHNGTGWEPDNTIVYNFLPQDYVTVGDALLSKYPDAAANVKRYASFEIRNGYTNEWTDEMFVEAVAVILNKIHPDAEDGQKYVVNVTTYAGTYGTKSVSVIKENGEWVAY